jgi:hypothetical protein
VTADEGPVKRATITLEGEGIKRVVNVTDGTYEIEAAPGIYRISAYDPAFCPAQRAPFRLNAFAVTNLDLIFVDCPHVNRLQIIDGKPVWVSKKAQAGPKGEVDGFEEPFKERTFQTPHPPGIPAELLIRFSKWDETTKVFQYQGGQVSYENAQGTQTKFLPVMVSYDTLTIYAKRVCLNRDTLRLVADGDVIVQDGQQSIHFQHVEVDFKASDPMATLTTR